MFYKWLLFLTLLPPILMAQSNQSVQLYQENELWGLRKESPITPAVYDTLILIDNTNFFIAKKHNKSSHLNSLGVITDKGKVIIPFSYLQIIPSRDNFIVKKWTNNVVEYGVIDHSNKPILNIRFKHISPFNQSWVVTLFSNQMQLFNSDGQLIKQLNSDSVSTAENSPYLYTYKEGRMGLIDNVGNDIFSTKYKSITPTDKGTWKTSLFNQWQIISSIDTAYLQADTAIVWDQKTVIIGVNKRFQLMTNSTLIGNNYQFIDIVSSTMGITKNDQLYGAIHKNGKELLSNRFAELHFNKGYFYTKSNGQWSIYDSLGNIRSIFTYDSIGQYNNGLFPIKRKGKWGFMNRDGQEVIHCIYDDKANFKKGKSIIKYFGATGIIDTNGNWIIKPQSAQITDFSFNFYIAKKDGLYYLKNYDNELIYFTSNTLIFKNETIYQVRDGYTNTISSLGTLVNNKVKTGEGSKFWQIIKIENKYGFENTKGLLKITYRYDSVLLFSEGLAAFKLRGKWGFINDKEDIVIQPIFSKVTSFNNGTVIVRQNKNAGLIFANGSYSLKPKFESIIYFADNLYLVKEEGLYGIYNSDGKIIIQPKYDQIKYINNDFIIVIRKGKYGTVDFTGKNMLPRIYDYIEYNRQNNLLILMQKGTS